MELRKAWLLLAALPLGAASPILGQSLLGTAFSYQGRLTDGGSPANGSYDFEFRLFNALTGGSPVGAALTVDNQQVSGGLFAVQLDFGGGVFTGDARWLQIAVRPGANTGAYTPLGPRQQVTAAPYSLYALSSGGDFWQQATGGIHYSAGKVGIGAAAPAARLDVAAPSVSEPSIVTRGGADYATVAGQVMTLGHWDGATYQQRIRVNGDGTILLGPDGGNVGIGLTAPEAKLDVAGDLRVGESFEWVALDAVGTNGVGATLRAIWTMGKPPICRQAQIRYDGSLHLLAATGDSTPLPTDGITIASSGTTGIGTASPLNRLHVEGPGTTHGGIPGYAEVVGYFRQTTAASGTAVSVDAGPEQDAILRLCESGHSYWSIRHDALNTAGDHGLDFRHVPFGSVDSTSVFRILPQGDAFETRIKGDLVVSGAFRGSLGPNDGGPCPRPAYDSGWKTSPGLGGRLTLTHNVGGDSDDYLVDMQFRSGSGLPFNTDLGSAMDWRELSSTSITVTRSATAVSHSKFRLRIWVTPASAVEEGSAGSSDVSKATDETTHPLVPHGSGGDNGAASPESTRNEKERAVQLAALQEQNAQLAARVAAIEEALTGLNQEKEGDRP